MAKTIMILGSSGSGKSTSLRNLPPEETLIISPNSKQLPWKGSGDSFKVGKNLIRVSALSQVPALLKKAHDTPKFKYVVVEDTTHLQNAKIMQDNFIASKDWGKWNIFAKEVMAMMVKDLETYRDDLTIIYICHTESKDDGTIGVRTSGKLLDNSIDIPSYFTVVLHSMILPRDGGKLEHVFLTNNNGQHLAKTPMGMFDEEYVENDIKKVIDTAKVYYGS